MVYRYLAREPLPDVGTEAKGGLVISHDEATHIEFRGKKYPCRYYTVDMARDAQVPRDKVESVRRPRGIVVNIRRRAR